MIVNERTKTDRATQSAAPSPTPSLRAGGLGGALARLRNSASRIAPRGNLFGLPAARVGGGGSGRFGALLLLPTLLATIYFGFLASDRYVSEAAFVVRSAHQGVSGGLGSFLQITGIARSQDDAFSVHEYIRSRDAVRDLEQMLPLREIFGRPEADFLAGYPNFLYGESEVELHEYYRRRVEVIYDTTTGISRLRVQAFRPEDAQKVAQALLDLSEALVNRMNERISSDAIRFAQAEVAEAERRLLEGQLAITDFRSRELMLDPEQSSLAVVEMVGGLSLELARVNAQIRQLADSSPNSPQLLSLRQTAASLEAQIAEERSQLAGASAGLAQKVADFERLTLEQDFLIRNLAAARTDLERARNEARRQLLYLVRIVEPRPADDAREPRRLRSILIVLGGSILVFFVGWLIMTGAREHAVERT